ncbi:MAG: hypothetical protein Q9184_007702 [Pyrenodesmia sp. 2 TL-2023]
MAGVKETNLPLPLSSLNTIRGARSPYSSLISRQLPRHNSPPSSPLTQYIKPSHHPHSLPLQGNPQGPPVPIPQPPDSGSRVRNYGEEVTAKPSPAEGVKK